MVLDGAHGEGGGQILRTALALSVALRRPVTVTRIRAGRPKPGLQPQHLAVVRALAEISDAEVEGDRLDSTELSFAPRVLRAGTWRFDVGAVKGSAGSVALVFEALLLPLGLADGPSRVVVVGGTHVPWSPPVHYVQRVVLPVLAGLGLRAELRLRRWGFYPAGGGEVEATVWPAERLEGFVAEAPPALERVQGLSAVARLPRSIAERQARRVEARLGAVGLAVDMAVEVDDRSLSPGTVVFLGVPARAGFSALGQRGVPAERVADQAVDALLAWRASGAAVDERLADQLLPFLALARTSSVYTCPRVTGHLETVAWVVRQFVPAAITLTLGPPARVSLTPPPSPRGGHRDAANPAG